MENMLQMAQFNTTPPVQCTAAMAQTNPGCSFCPATCTPAAGAVVHKGSGWTLDAGPWDEFPCDPAQPMAQPNITSLPFCDRTKPRSER